MSKSLTKSIIIASDHAGFLMKEKVKIFLNKSKIKSLDLGTFSEERVDYPDYAKKLALSVKKIFFWNINLWLWNRSFYCSK